MGVGDDLLDASIESHVLGLEAMRQLVDPLLELVNRELLGLSATLGHGLARHLESGDLSGPLGLLRVRLIDRFHRWSQKGEESWLSFN